jgi:hypothetical protein
VLLIQHFLHLIFTNDHNKLVRFSLESLSSLVKCLQVRPEPALVKHLKIMLKEKIEEHSSGAKLFIISK